MISRYRAARSPSRRHPRNLDSGQHCTSIAVNSYGASYTSTMSAYSPFEVKQLVFYWLLFGRFNNPWDRIAQSFNCLFGQNRTKEALRKKFFEVAKFHVEHYCDLSTQDKRGAVATIFEFHLECTRDIQLGDGRIIPIDLSRGPEHFFETISLVVAPLRPALTLPLHTRKIQYGIPELGRRGEFTLRDRFADFQEACYSSDFRVQIWELQTVRCLFQLHHLSHTYLF